MSYILKVSIHQPCSILPAKDVARTGSRSYLVLSGSKKNPRMNDIRAVHRQSFIPNDNNLQPKPTNCHSFFSAFAAVFD